MPKTDLNPRIVIPGDRIILIRAADPHTRLRAGDRGVVDHVDAVGTVHVRWADGHYLGLCPDTDRYELVR